MLHAVTCIREWDSSHIAVRGFTYNWASWASAASSLALRVHSQIQILTSLQKVDVLSEALPLLQKFRGKTIVVKYGGAAMKDPTLKVCESASTLFF